MHRRILDPTLFFLAVLFLCFGQSVGDCQESDTDTEDELPEIVDEPKTVDPSEFMPAPLAAKATQDFSDSSLREVVDWLRTEVGLVVLVNDNALNEIGISAAEPISDRLEDAPVFLMLDRLSTIGIDWYFDEDILYLTSKDEAEQRATMQTYNVGDLLDAEYELDVLDSVIVNTIAADTWADVGGNGDLNALGDVLFVRQTSSRQRKVSGLLSALREHSRRTFVDDPIQHLVLRDKLEENVTVEFVDMPLVTAIEHLGEIAGVDLRLDFNALRDYRIREREPVTLTLSDRKLKTVLQAIVMELNLTWVLRDGVILITSLEEAEMEPKTAVYDVRDLCRDDYETNALADAITAQTDPNSWVNVGGIGVVESAKAGTLVITHQEHMHTEVLELLETYRMALRNSKPRENDVDNDDEIITVYYRLHTAVAKDMTTLLPQLVQPGSWEDANQPEAPGRILLSASSPDLQTLEMMAKAGNAAGDSPSSMVTSRSVLIIRQTRKNHEKIEEVLARVEQGDSRSGTGGMGGLGGGGFGGGLFSIPKRLNESVQDR